MKKGYEIQKISVSCNTITLMFLKVVNNLDRYMQEGGANEELFSLIIVSYFTHFDHGVGLMH